MHKTLRQWVLGWGRVITVMFYPAFVQHLTIYWAQEAALMEVCSALCRVPFYSFLSFIIYIVGNNIRVCYIILLKKRTTETLDLLFIYSFECVKKRSVRCCLLVFYFKCHILLSHAVHFWNINLTRVSHPWFVVCCAVFKNKYWHVQMSFFCQS